MIKFLTKTALVASVLAATPAFAQSVDGNPATATGDARVRILAPLSIDATDGILDFGVLVKSGAVAGTTYDFTVTPAGVFGGCNAAWACSAAKQAAGFTVTGSADESVQVSIPTTAIDLDATALDNLSLVLSLSGDGDSNGDADLPLGVAGSATFSVGGTLTVDGAVPTGVYAAPFTVSAEYL